MGNRRAGNDLDGRLDCAAATQSGLPGPAARAVLVDCMFHPVDGERRFGCTSNPVGPGNPFHSAAHLRFFANDPVAPNTTEAGRQQNRRTDIKVVLNAE